MARPTHSKKIQLDGDKGTVSMQTARKCCTPVELSVHVYLWSVEIQAAAIISSKPRTQRAPYR